MRPAWSSERAFVYAYLFCAIIVSIGTIDQRSHHSLELWQLQPALGVASRLTMFALTPAVVGLLVCPLVFAALTIRGRLSWPGIIGCLALLDCSYLTFV